MPLAKRQKAARNSGASVQDPDGHSSDSVSESVHSPRTSACSNAKSKDYHSQDGGKSKENRKQAAPYEYICFHRPLFDVEGENWLKWSTDPDAHVDEEEVFETLFKPNWDKETEQGIQGSSPEKHPGHKWVIMYNAWIKFDLIMRKAQYCDPDVFGMDLYSDWKSRGLTEILENMMIEFNDAYRSKAPNRIEDMWVIISAVGLWFNRDDHFERLTMSEDGDSVAQILGVMGRAVLTVLAAIERAGELKPDSRFLDLALVIGYYIDFCHDLPAYGFDGETVSWRKHVVEYFKKANLDPAKATATTKQRMEKIKKGDDEHDEGEIRKDAEKENTSPKPATSKRKRDSVSASEDTKKEEDIWGWDQSFNKYKKDHHPKMGGTHYDITKMSRTDRKEASFDSKDPLAGVPAKALKENLLDFK